MLPDFNTFATNQSHRMQFEALAGTIVQVAAPLWQQSRSPGIEFEHFERSHGHSEIRSIRSLRHHIVHRTSYIVHRTSYIVHRATTFQLLQDSTRWMLGECQAGSNLVNFLALQEWLHTLNALMTWMNESGAWLHDFHSVISKCWKSVVRTNNAPSVCPAPPVVSVSWNAVGKSKVIRALPEVGALPMLCRNTTLPSKPSGSFCGKMPRALVPEASMR